MSNIADLSATQLLSGYRSRELSPVEVARDVLDRIDRFNPLVGAFSQLFPEETLAMARASEQRWAKREPAGVLDGLPVTVKDMLWQRGRPNYRGSKTTSSDLAVDDAPAVASLRAAGGVFVGRTTLSEFAWKATTDSPHTGVARNPWCLSVTPGGSSGGAAVAAALNLGVMHIGTDAGGSIRVPASFTGTYGIKPSYGRVPAYPGSAFSLLSHIGPMTRTVDDAVLMLQSISKPDFRDLSGINHPAFSTNLSDRISSHSMKGLRIAFSTDLGYVTCLDPEVAMLTEKAAKAFENMGAHVEEATPLTSDPINVIRTLWEAGAAAALADVAPDQLALMDKGLIACAERGRRHSAVDYVKALGERSSLLQQMLAFHQKYDLLLTPAVPIPAFDVCHDVPPDSVMRDWFQWVPYSYPFNLTQQPAASVPCGLTTAGLPVGLQIVGGPRQDILVLAASKAYQDACPQPVITEPL